MSTLALIAFLASSFLFMASDGVLTSDMLGRVIVTTVVVELVNRWIERQGG